MYFTCIERVRAVGLRLDPSFRRNDAGAWRTWCRRGRPPWCRRYQRCFHPECWTRSGSSWPANNIINWIVILSSIDGARLSLQKLTLPAIFHANKSGYWLKFSTSNNRNSVWPSLFTILPLRKADSQQPNSWAMSLPNFKPGKITRPT